MALDGITVRFLKNELEPVLIGARAEKIYMPAKNELVIVFRTRNGAFRLFFSCAGSSSRVNLTEFAPDNPDKPPMLCMLLRKHLSGAVLKSIRQHGFDRILFFDFDATNEIGDKVCFTLCAEIMAQRSNIILINENGKIVDAVKRIDDENSAREILPGGTYVLPPLMEKSDLTTADIKALSESIAESDAVLSKAILNAVEGVSPLIGREIAFRICGEDKTAKSLTFSQIKLLKNELEVIENLIVNNKPESVLLLDADSKPRDFSYMPITQYDNAVITVKAESISELMDTFFYEKDRAERTHKRAGDLYKILNNAIERVARRVNNQMAELKECDNKEQLRIFGELITANQYSLEKGAAYFDLPNYYDDNKEIRIPVNPAFSPQKNAQKYYKDYKKAHTAEKMLTGLIEQGKTELVYLESVLDSLSRAETEPELAAIRNELSDGNYIKKRKVIKQKQKELPFLEYKTSDGFKVLVGRNNIQNDKLTFKTANNHDIWLHTQGVAGSHTIILSDKKEITGTAILEAAQIAAYHSKARDSKNVPVDYTSVKNLRKPNGSPYGFVVYNTYKTILVTPKEK